MTKLIVLRGIPGSGKTTWAKKYQKEHPDTVRVNRDEIRAMLHDGVYSKENEKFVTFVEESIAEFALLQQQEVIVDDTNLNPKTFARWVEMVENNSALHACNDDLSVELEVKDFDTPLEDCIKNDSKRSGKAFVGEKVVRDFWEKYKNVDTT